MMEVITVEEALRLAKQEKVLILDLRPPGSYRQFHIDHAVSHSLDKIENGELTDPINKAMISGNIFEIMKKVEGLKSEIKQYGQFIIPKLLVHDLRVVGQK